MKNRIGIRKQQTTKLLNKIVTLLKVCTYEQNLYSQNGLSKKVVAVPIEGKLEWKTNEKSKVYLNYATGILMNKCIDLFIQFSKQHKS